MNDPQGAQAGARPGPRPLALHLATALILGASSLAAWPLARHGSLAWSRRLKPAAAALVRDLAAVDPERFAAALAEESLGRQQAMLDGIERYRRHPYRRRVAEPPVAWQVGSARLLDYGGSGPAVLCVCSLVNRAYVLDLKPDRSLVRWLRACGFRPLLLDWGEPGPEELGFDLARYITLRLEPALAHAAALAGEAVHVLGYCMGGTLATALATRRPAEIRSLALIAAPWDFGAADPFGLARLAVALDLIGDRPVPVDWLQAYFALLDPGLALRKFAAFAGWPEGDPRLADFVAIEDWVNDGVTLAAGVAQDCLIDWYGGNAPGLGHWAIAGTPVEPRALAKPSLVVVPASDRLVPPAAAAALAAAIPGAVRLDVASGHIGMMVGGRAETLLWRPLAEWLALNRATAAAQQPRPRAPAPGRRAPSRRAAAGAVAG